jgi:hypothetical protein
MPHPPRPDQGWTHPDTFPSRRSPPEDPIVEHRGESASRTRTPACRGNHVNRPKSPGEFVLAWTK